MENIVKEQTHVSKTGVCLVFFLFKLFILYFFKHGIVHCLTKEEEIKKGLLTSHNITTHLILDFCLYCGYCLGGIWLVVCYHFVCV